MRCHILSEEWDDWFRRRRRLWGPFYSDFDKLFKEMEKEMEDAFKDIRESVPDELVKEKRLPDGSKVREFGPFVYGYSIRVGPDGKPVIREFGNIKPELEEGQRPAINVRDKREPIVDVFEQDSEIRILAELPGVDKDDIKLFVTERALTISVDTPDKKYYKELELPAEVLYDQAKTNYNNGVLEITLKKKERSRGGVQLKIA